ncbi:internalin A precursor InlA [Streptococcus equi subsp. equi]|nr:internalin A precursor InlA [Streptococcus equi subsp. equi]
MKSKKLMLMASLFMACHLTLTACQSTKQPTNQPKTNRQLKKRPKRNSLKRLSKQEKTVRE